MIARYTALLNVPHPFDGSWNTAELGRFKTLERAISRCERVLSKHGESVTRYGSRHGHFHGSIYDEKRKAFVRVTGDDAERLTAPETLVPSVGELGYTP